MDSNPTTKYAKFPLEMMTKYRVHVCMFVKPTTRFSDDNMDFLRLKIRNITDNLGQYIITT